MASGPTYVHWTLLTSALIASLVLGLVLGLSIGLWGGLLAGLGVAILSILVVSFWIKRLAASEATRLVGESQFLTPSSSLTPSAVFTARSKPDVSHSGACEDISENMEEKDKKQDEKVITDPVVLTSGTSTSAAKEPESKEEEKKEEKTLISSKNKAAFMSGLNEHSSDMHYQLSVGDLRVLAAHYKEKLGIDIIINGSFEEKSEEMRNQSLDFSTSEVIQEMNKIQEKLKRENSDAWYGYVYTGGFLDDSDKKHFEVMLISKDRIIKPVQWPFLYLPACGGLKYLFLNKKDIYSFYFNFQAEQVGLKFPQADGYSCGTLGMLYLKEMLKDQAKQLNESTLHFRICSEEKSIQYVFIPSPQTLRYSQSSQYNELVKHVLTREEKASISLGENTVNTIDYLLKVSMTMAQEKIKANQGKLQNEHLGEQEKKKIEDELIESETILKENQDILNKLPVFRKKWLAEYEVMCAQRAAMDYQGSAQAKKRNYYLKYRALKFEKRLTQALDQNQGTGLGLNGPS